MKSLLAAVLAAATGVLACACTSHGSALPAATVTITAHPATSSATAGSSAGSPTQPSSPATTTPAASPGGSQTTTVTTANGTAQGAASAALGCLSRYLGTSIGLTQGTAGSTYVVIDFKNLNNAPCTLYGYPGIAQAGGKPVTQIGASARWNPATSRKLITLAPGGIANSLLQIADASNYPAAECDPVTAHWLMIIPPNQTVPIPTYYTSTACAKPEPLLTANAMRRGSGG